MIESIVTFLTTLWEIVIILFERYFRKITIEDPENHLVLITGCDSGIGLMTAQKCLKLGYYVVALCLTEKGVTELEEFSLTNSYKRCLVIKADVTKEEDVKHAAQKVEETLNGDKKLKLWAVVNNAGIAPTGFLDWMSMDAYRNSMGVNFFGVVTVTKCFLQLLKKCKYSRIINVSSMAGQYGFPHGTAYAG
jgi:NAD(P)-dependent dehydrogenase (short-subunit alcohol dehydrogenase family)